MEALGSKYEIVTSGFAICHVVHGSETTAGLRSLLGIQNFSPLPQTY